MKESIMNHKVIAIVSALVLVTTVGRDGKQNVLAVAWITPISVNPPYLGISIKPRRYSHKLLLLYRVNASHHACFSFAVFDVRDLLILILIFCA